MNPKIVYPIPKKQSQVYRRIRNIVRIVFLISALVCVLINLLTKGKPWSLIVLWSLFSLWQTVFSLELIEYSIFSHISSIFIYIIVLLIIIDRFIAPGWADTVVPIVFFGALLIMSIIYFATYERKDRHIYSIFVLGVISILGIPYYTHSWPIKNWLGFSFQIATFVLFIVLIIINRKDIMIELKTRFKRKDN